MALEVPLWIQNGKFPSYSDRTLISTLLSPGIPERPITASIPPTVGDLRATLLTSAPPVINVAAGTVVINGTDQTRQGEYVCRSTTDVQVNLDARPASGSRQDLIFARVIDTSAGVTGTDGWVIDKVSGVAAASNPTVPANPSSSESLASVLVPSGAGAITITDLRRRALSGVFPPMGLQAYGMNASGFDNTQANSPQRLLTLNATLPAGTYRVAARGQATVITALPIWINMSFGGTGLIGGYVYGYNTVGTSLGNVWPGASWAICTLTQPTACSWYVNGSIGGQGAQRVYANNVQMTVDRIG